MFSSELSSFVGVWLPQIESEIRAVVDIGDDTVTAHYGMMQYHLGWADEHFQPFSSPTGKRLRPIFCLAACAEVGGDPVQAMPAAAAIELLHNFSLIHDDVEDGDELRRHRPTVWKLWGVPQAINAGDGMFSLAFSALQRLRRRGATDATVLAALDHFTRTCLSLTEGQYLDLSFEERTVVSVDEYLRMIQGKTAALVGASVAIGALIGGATPVQTNDMLQFGQAVGMAFQIQDDILGIWGDPEVTGKAAGNDIVRRKKSLPLLYALNHVQTEARMRALLADSMDPVPVPTVMSLLEEVDARRFAEIQMQQQHTIGLEALDAALGQRAASSSLLALADGLLNRTR